MGDPYPILTIQPDEIVGDEALGSKTKFWFQREGKRWLFKEARENTGEDWAEKIAAEIAHRLAIPAATVELAEFQSRRGSASLSFVDAVQGETLIHGNDLLAGLVVGYDRNKRFGQSDHTLENIYRAIRKLFPKKEQHTPILTELASYMVLDALIANTDRHHENWGLVVRVENRVDSTPNVEIRVAPTFDHASSLGRELRDERRAVLLNAGRMVHYVLHGRGGVYLRKFDEHGANPMALVEFGTEHYREYFFAALCRLSRMPISDLTQPINRVPDTRISSVARGFARALLRESCTRLCELLK